MKMTKIMEKQLMKIALRQCISLHFIICSWIFGQKTTL